uniref:NADH-ubiquinone oxidoreductase chain 2 n=1 Tax=Falcidens halanychi TaxID=370642 RepID=A0A343X879_9MOLL|nr:NADH dehydrogenase subunit 2 [Falcidens halanychi]AWH02138.1 NADH dehydrogenase subunit 2 [Falcidens halanychi]
MWPIYFFFSFFMFLGIFFMIFSPSWVIIWIGLEMNLFGFLPLMVDMKENQTLEATMKYFLIQAFGSGMFLGGSFFSLIFLETWFSLSLTSNNYFPDILLFLAIAIKMGLAPFYIWLPSIMSSISWSNCVLLNTFQKIGPMLLFTKFFSFNTVSMVMISMSTLVGGVMGVIQTQIRTIMAYSSLVHLGWILALGMFSMYGMIQYMTIYFFLSSSIFLYCMKPNLSRFSLKSPKALILIISFLSLGGLPPMSGFFMKWVGMKILMSQTHLLLNLTLILGSVLSLFFYLNLLFSWISFYPKQKFPTFDKKDLSMLCFSGLGLSLLF